MLFRLPIVKFFNRILNRITVTVVLVALQLANWQAGDLNADGVLNGFDLCLLREKLLVG